MIVLDTSAAINALGGSPPNPSLVARLTFDADLHAPHLIDIEFLNALRRLVATEVLSADRAADIRTNFADLTIMRYPHGPIADRIWELRHQLTAYDAAFIALSEALAVPLLTLDARLASAGGHDAAVEVFVH